MTFVYMDDSERWLEDLLANHYEEARSRVLSLVAKGKVTETGCIETETEGPRKVRFYGR